MQSEVLELSYDEMELIAENLSSKADEMNEILANVKNEFQMIGEKGVWSGDAAAASRAEFDELSAKFPNFVEAIDDCSKYLRNVVANYKAAEQTIKGQQ